MLKSHLIKALVVLLVFTGIIWTRVLYLQRSHFTAAEKYRKESNYKLAIREYDTTMHFYTPLSPYIGRAASGLWQIGEMFEKQDRPDWAHIAYSSIRSSFYASRGLYTPGKDWIEKCDEKIAALNVRILLKEGSISAEEAKAEKAKHLYVLKQDRAPDVLWTVLAEAGFFGWVGSVVFIIFKGFENMGRIRGRHMLYGIVSFGLTFALWIAALLKA